MFLNTKLQSREKPIKVAFIGCGKFVSMFLAQYNQLQKITIDTIVDINIDNAKKNCLKSGLTTETVNKINFVTTLDEAIDRDVEVFIKTSTSLSIASSKVVTKFILLTVSVVKPLLRQFFLALSILISTIVSIVIFCN